ncbi:COX15/CtaA family protein [Pedomonas mirosovicensis]|uniref:COX15/CtaA family protein n=1 Tax=Pedomonas mirosovicensis TaxID=2908641 RepID=UPI00216857C6|nr:COX15/CtaA family protein [Pedomonas mirosovicensis]MCH8685922.1 COX15/CtaA family protein [Pedomonas mirosovicensis]
MSETLVTLPATDAKTRSSRRAIATWLLLVAGLVFLMVVVGGATRLTESGLSIVEWKPISGAIPPLTDADWQAEFEAYKKIPEYQQEHAWMSLEDFKGIFWWEWSHRLLGRLIGLVYAIPFFWFLARRRIPEGYKKPLFGLLLLGGLQGAIGWWMVSSGLSERTDVSHYRLATHLGVALTIYAGLIWTALNLLADRTRQNVPPGVNRWALPFFALLALQIVMGAFVAGLNAGFAFNTWPLMGDSFAPPHMWEAALGWLNLSENGVVVQFVHRCIAYALAIVGVLWILAGWRTGIVGMRDRAMIFAIALAAQITLGILTIIHAVPIPLGVAHQGGAAALLAAALYYAHRGRSITRVA